jgi:ribosomal protein S9
MYIKKALIFSQWKTEIDKGELNKTSQLQKYLIGDKKTMEDKKTHLTRARKRWMDWQSQESLASIKRRNAEHNSRNEGSCK